MSYPAKTRKRNKVNRSITRSVNRQKRRIPKTGKPIRRRKRTQRMYKGGAGKGKLECCGQLRTKDHEIKELREEKKSQAAEIQRLNERILELEGQQEDRTEGVDDEVETTDIDLGITERIHFQEEKKALEIKIMYLEAQLEDKTAELNDKTAELNNKTTELAAAARKYDVLSDENLRNYHVATEMLQLFDTYVAGQDKQMDALKEDRS